MQNYMHEMQNMGFKIPYALALPRDFQRLMSRGPGIRGKWLRIIGAVRWQRWVPLSLMRRGNMPG